MLLFDTVQRICFQQNKTMSVSVRDLLRFSSCSFSKLFERTRVVQQETIPRRLDEKPLIYRT